MASLCESLTHLKALYAELPPVPCNGCGRCCVTPHMTFVEFAYLLEGVCTHLPPAAQTALLQQPMRPARRYPGNCVCALQDSEKRCRLHPFRALACRLEGLPILDRMGFRDAVICPYITDADMTVEVTAAMVEAWVDRCFSLNHACIGSPAEPYWVESLNVECWFAVLLDPRLTQPYFLELRAQLTALGDAQALSPHYVDHTGFADKVSCIDAFFAASAKQEARQARASLRRALEAFPRTGTHYQREGQEYLRFVERVIAREEG